MNVTGPKVVATRRCGYDFGMADSSGSLDFLLDLVFLLATGMVAWHGIRYRDAEGRPDLVRLLFASIAALFFVMVLFRDVLGLVRF